MKTTEPIRDKNQVKQMMQYYINRNEPRNAVLVSLSIHTALRIGDLLKLTCDDVYNFSSKTVRKTITLTENKTGKNKIIALNKVAQKALKAYFPHAKPGTPLLLNMKTNKAISRIQAHRLIKSASEALGFETPASCHSLRKTFGYHAWKNGVSPAVIMEIYNHSSLAITRRYLGVSQDDQNSVYLNLDFTD